VPEENQKNNKKKIRIGAHWPRSEQETCPL